MAITPTCGLGNFAGSGRYSAPLVALGENCTNCGGGAAANAGAAIASTPARANVTLSMGYSSGVNDVRLAFRPVAICDWRSRKAIEQQAIGLVALEHFLAAVSGEIFVVELVQFLSQQPEREPREERIAALDVAPDGERRRHDRVHQQVVHQR